MPSADTTQGLSPAQLALCAVGDGVPKRHTEKPKVTAQQLKAKPSVWHDKPQYPEQMLDTSAVRQIRQETYMLDLSKESDVLKYQELQNLEFAANTNRYLLTQDRRFDDKAGKFIVYVEVGVFQFKELLPADMHKPK